jgi:hypothetical protein
MTNHPAATNPNNGRLNSWLAEQVIGLDAAISDMLDIEAGLRDARLHDQVRSLDSAVAATLDIEAGLRAILPESEYRPPLVFDDRIGAVAGKTRLEQLALDLFQSSLQERVRVRSQLPLIALRMVHKAGVALLRRIGVPSTIDLPEMVLLVERAVSVAIDLTRPRHDATDLARTLQELRPFATAIVTDLDAVHDRARIDVRRRRRTGPGAEAFAEALFVARDHARSVVEALERIRVKDLPETLEDVDDLDVDLVNELIVALMEARVRLVGAGTDEARALQFANEFVTAMQILDSALTDFTHADLTDLDLADVDLLGVWWSDRTTRWPAEWEVPILDASVQLDPNGRADLYEIRGDPRIRHTVQ